MLQRTAQTQTQPQSLQVQAAGASSDRATVVKLVNAERSKRGLKPLRSNAGLNSAAQAWAKRLCASGQPFEHSSPSWQKRHVPKGWTRFGENIAAGQRSPKAVMTAWMGSPGHKANILTKDFRDIGVGRCAAKDSRYGVYWVQIFGTYPASRPAK